MRLRTLFTLLFGATLVTATGFYFYEHTATKGCPIIRDEIRTAREALEMYHLKHGQYPELPNFQSMVDMNSPLVKENLLPVYVKTQDRWGQPYIGFSTKSYFKLECLGDPTNQKDFPSYVSESGLTSRSTRTQP